MFFLSELISTPDGGLTATFAALLSVVFIALKEMITKWMNQKKDTTERNLIIELSKQFDFNNPESIVCKVDEMGKKIVCIEKDTQHCVAELKYNGGGSTKDLALKTHTKVQGLESDIKRIRAQQRARLEWQLNKDDLPMLVFDEHGDCTFSNKQFQLLAGISNEDCLLAGWLRFVASQTERKAVLESWRDSVKLHIAFKVTFQAYNEISKRVFYVEMCAEPAHDDEGRPMWYSATIEEINNGQQNQKRLS